MDIVLLNFFPSVIIGEEAIHSMLLLLRAFASG